MAGYCTACGGSGFRRPSKKTPADIRQEAAQLALRYAEERWRCGDPESSEEFRNLAKSINKIHLRNK